eukprot:349855-Chlamydomonas_euryale.AAC.4
MGLTPRPRLVPLLRSALPRAACAVRHHIASLNPSPPASTQPCAVSRNPSPLLPHSPAPCLTALTVSLPLAPPPSVLRQTLVLVESVERLEHCFKALDLFVKHLDNCAGKDISDCESTRCEGMSRAPHLVHLRTCTRFVRHSVDSPGGRVEAHAHSPRRRGETVRRGAGWLGHGLGLRPRQTVAAQGRGDRWRMGERRQWYRTGGGRGWQPLP